MLRGLARIRAEEATAGARAHAPRPAETSQAETLYRVEHVTDLDPAMPFGIPAGELS